MKNIKHMMIERQLICRDISDNRVFDAFSNVDREDYIEPKYKKYSYVDIEIPVNLSESFILRPYFLAKIISKIVEWNPTRVLVVGDVSCYTTAILNNIYSFKCVSLTEQEFLLENIDKFDVIYFDSKIYGQSVINKSKGRLMNEGRAIYMSGSDHEHFLMKKFIWKEIDVLEKTYSGAISKLFSFKISTKEG